MQHPYKSTDSQLRRLPNQGGKMVTEVYTDGSSMGNGRKGARAGWGVYYGEGDQRNRAGRTSGAQTNQRSELRAVNEALRQSVSEARAGNTNDLRIFTDSQYAKKSMNEWADTWERNGYKNASGQDVANKDLVQEGRKLLRELADNNVGVDIQYVPGHSGFHGNEMADRLAREGATRPP
jgi:ribonuclease HI